MPIELPIPWIIALNCGGLPALQIGMAWVFTRMPARWFEAPPHADTPPPRRRSRRPLVRWWKAHLPDGARWFAGGFAKARLAGRDPAYLARFVTETRRGEACHWTALACIPVFFLWNPWWADLIIAGYALAANLPCIVVQRYNRRRLRHLLAGRRGATHGPPMHEAA